MSHEAVVPSLEARSDQEFEAQVHADARQRLLQAHARSSRSSRSPHIRFSRHASRARGRRRLACLVAGAAFGAGLLWPVATPEAQLQPTLAAAPQGRPQTARALRGELLAALESPAQVAR